MTMLSTAQLSLATVETPVRVAWGRRQALGAVQSGGRAQATPGAVL
ncbi:MAG TPA: hypothetical protein PLW65_14735 [Pseudomonadota bacterium]|nr:hypothetical protein [Pseudomonadota bacterium]